MNQSLDISDVKKPAGAMTSYLLGAFAIGQALNVNDGNYDIIGLIWIGIAMLSLFVGLSGPRDRWLARLPIWKLVAVFLAIQWIQLLLWGLGFRRLPGSSSAWFITGLLIAAGGAALLFARANLRVVGLLVLIAGHTLAGVDVLRNRKDVFIDAHYFQQESTAALLTGQNPYGVRYRNIYGPATDYYGPDVVAGDHLTVSHPYPPLTLLLAMPARIAGDVRWAHLVSIELAAILIALATRRPYSAFAAAIMLLSPRTLMVEYFGWTEAMVLLCMAFLLFCAIRAPKLLWLALGLLLAVKQYTILLLPLAVLVMPRPIDWRKGARVIASAVAVAAAITAPFVLWDPAAFLRSVILMQMRQPFRIDALSFPALLYHVMGIQVPSIVAFVLAGAAVFWCLRRAPRSVAGFAGASALVLLVFFAFNKQAFCNYYFLTAGVCCAAFGAVIPDQQISIQQDEQSAARRLAA